MTYARKAGIGVALLALLMLLATVGTAPTLVGAADHLDAPGLASPGNDARLDVNDLFVFEGADTDNTVLALTVNPAAAGDSTFATKQEGSYHIRIDTNGDAIEDITYAVTFDDSSDGQSVKVRRTEGRTAQSMKARGRTIGSGDVGDVISLSRGGQAWAGLRSDPFFFDLGGFLGTVEGLGDRNLNDGDESDFFADLNTLAIVIEVPDSELGDQIGVWATTTSRDRWRATQVDRMGRPAINTVVNSSGPIVNAPSDNKNVFNGSLPKNDVASFTGAVVNALQAFSSLDSEGAYSDDAAAALAGVLLPDVLTYDTNTMAAGPLNGRALADDVIDIELRIVTGGDPLGLFDDRDADGGVNTDGIGPHDDYLSTFPYLGEPNA